MGHHPGLIPGCRFSDAPAYTRSAGGAVGATDRGLPALTAGVSRAANQALPTGGAAVVVAAALGAQGTAAVLGIGALHATCLPAAPTDGRGPVGWTAVVVAVGTAADDIARPPVGATRHTAVLVRTADLAIRAGDTPAGLVRVLFLVLLRLFESFLLLIAVELLALVGLVMCLGILDAPPAEQTGQEPAGKAAHGGAAVVSDRVRSSKRSWSTRPPEHMHAAPQPCPPRGFYSTSSWQMHHEGYGERFP